MADKQVEYKDLKQYEQSDQTWKKQYKKPSLNDLALKKLIAKLNREEREQRIKQFAEDPEKNVFKGSSIQTLAKIFADDTNEKHQQLIDTINKLDATFKANNATAIDLGLTRTQMDQNKKEALAAENDFIQKKIGAIPTADNLNTILKRLNAAGVDTSLINHSKLRDLIALDDWKDWAKKLLPAIVEYGPKVVSAAWENIVKPLIPTGGDEGIQGFDFKSPVLQPFIESKVPGINYYPPGQDRRDAQQIYSTKRSTDISGVQPDVNCKAIATVLCPSQYKDRVNCDTPKRMALASGSTTYPITVSGSGNTQGSIGCAMVTIMPANYQIMAIKNGNDFSAVTGVGTVVSTSHPFIVGAQTAFTSARLTACALRVIPLISQNANGSIETTWIDTGDVSGAPSGYQYFVVPSDMEQYSNYQITNGYVTTRMNMPYNSASNAILTSGSGGYGWTEWQILFKGFPAGVQVANLVIDWVFEFSPTPLVSATAPIGIADQGINTVNMIRNLHVEFPLLVNLNQEVAEKLSTLVYSLGSNNYYEVVAIIKKFLLDYTAEAVSRQAGPMHNNAKLLQAPAGYIQSIHNLPLQPYDLRLGDQIDKLGVHQNTVDALERARQQSGDTDIVDFGWQQQQ